MMAELWRNPDDWMDYAGNCPPAAWDGEKYHFLVGDTLTYQGIALAGDTLTITGTIGDAINTTVSASSEYPPDNFVQPLWQVSSAGDFDSSGTLLNDGTDGRQEGYRGTYVDVGGGGRNGYSCDITFAVPAPIPVEKCTELGRVTRCYVSGYQRDRIHESRLVRGEYRCLVANFNGAVDQARTIASVTWRCQQGYAAVMSNARIAAGGREAALDIRAQLGGMAWLKCIVTFDNGEQYTQLFRILIEDAPWFADESPAMSGPSVLTVP